MPRQDTKLLQSMIRATRRDRDMVLTILNQSFIYNPHSNWLISGKDRGPVAKLKKLIAYTFDYGLLHGSVYLTNDVQGAAIWKRFPEKRLFWKDLLLNLRFITGFDLASIRRILTLESYIARQRPREAYWYLWMLGVLPQSRGRSISSQLLDPLLEMAQRDHLPVLLETSTLDNVALYTHKGFRVYHEYQPDPGREITIYFMRKDP